MKYITTSGAEIATLIIDQEFWVSTRGIAAMFGITHRNVKMHAKNLEEDGLLDNECRRIFPITSLEGTREITRQVAHYNPKGVYLFAMRMRSLEAFRFQAWAAEKLYQLKRDGVAYDDNRRPQLPDNSQEFANLQAKLAESEAKLAESEAKIAELQSRIDQIAFLAGGRPKTQVPLLPVSSGDLLENKIIRIIQGFHERKGAWPTAREIRNHTGRNSVTRKSRTAINKVLEQLISQKVIEPLLYKGKRVCRYRLMAL